MWSSQQELIGYLVGASMHTYFVNQNLMIQAIRSNEQYFKLMVLKSQTKRFVASGVCFVSFLAVYVYTQLVPKLYTFSVCSV